MIVLTRRKGEQLTIFLPNGEEVILTVTKVSGGQTRLGFDCSNAVKIFRNELLDEEGKMKEWFRANG